MRESYICFDRAGRYVSSSIEERRIEYTAPDRARRCGAASCGLYHDGVPGLLWRPLSFQQQLHRSSQQRSPSHRNSCILESSISYGDQNYQTHIQTFESTRLHTFITSFSTHMTFLQETFSPKKQKTESSTAGADQPSVVVPTHYNSFISIILLRPLQLPIDRRCTQLMDFNKINRLMHAEIWIETLTPTL